MTPEQKHKEELLRSFFTGTGLNDVMIHTPFLKQLNEFKKYVPVKASNVIVTKNYKNKWNKP